MKQIKKRTSPIAFEAWKKNYQAKNGNTLQDLYEQTDMTGKKLWGALSTPKLTSNGESRVYSKEELKEVLLDEQMQICCYCNRTIAAENTTIEHFKPKGNRLYFKLAYDYNNLFASCDGFAAEPKPRDICCNVKRLESELLPFNQTEEWVETHFDFTIDGQIVGITPKGVETIRQLGLDIEKLNNLRAAYIKDYLYENPFSELPELISKEEAIESIKTLKMPVDGALIPFCVAIIKVLEREIING